MSRAATQPPFNFGPDASAQVKKMGVTAEAGRPKGNVMSLVAERTILDQHQFTERHAGRHSDMWKLAEVTPRRVSWQEAAEYLKSSRYQRQVRDLTFSGKQHVAVLADIMARGKWRPFDQIDVVRLHGQESIINGHHRFGAQVLARKDIDWTIVVHNCSSEDEVKDLYYTFDTNVRGRSNETILNSLDAAELFGLTKTTAEALYRAAPLLSAAFDFSKKDRNPVFSRVIDRRIDVMRVYHVAAGQWEKAVAKAPVPIKRRLRNQGAIAVALMCFKNCPERACEFWKGVADNDGLRRGDPRHTYLLALQGHLGAEIGTAEHSARQASLAWNAWFSGRDLKIIKVSENHNFRILGTTVGR